MQALREAAITCANNANTVGRLYSVLSLACSCRSWMPVCTRRLMTASHSAPSHTGAHSPPCQQPCPSWAFVLARVYLLHFLRERTLLGCGRHNFLLHAQALAFSDAVQ